MLTTLLNWFWPVGVSILATSYLCWKYLTGGFMPAGLETDTLKKSVSHGLAAALEADTVKKSVVHGISSIVQAYKFKESVVQFLISVGFSVAAVLVAYATYVVSTIAVLWFTIIEAKNGSVETAGILASTVLATMVAISYCRKRRRGKR